MSAAGRAASRHDGVAAWRVRHLVRDGAKRQFIGEVRGHAALLSRMDAVPGPWSESPDHHPPRRYRRALTAFVATVTPATDKTDRGLMSYLLREYPDVLDLVSRPRVLMPAGLSLRTLLAALLRAALAAVRPPRPRFAAAADDDQGRSLPETRSRTVLTAAPPARVLHQLRAGAAG